MDIQAEKQNDKISTISLKFERWNAKELVYFDFMFF